MCVMMMIIHELNMDLNSSDDFISYIVSCCLSNEFVSYIGKPPGYDRVRSAEIGNKDFELDVLEEAYTTEHWLVRIYKVKDLRNRGV